MYLFLLQILVLIVWTDLRCTAADDSVLAAQDKTTNGDHDSLWAVQIEGGSSVADMTAEKLGMVNLGQIGGLENYYHFALRDVAGRSKRSVDEVLSTIQRRMEESGDVAWFEEQKPLERVKRDFLQERDYVRVVQKTTDEQKMKRSFELDLSFNDKLYAEQWCIQGTRTVAIARSVENLDLGIREVWLSGFTGKNIRISVVDDGLEWNHTDILPNYAQEASYDAQGFDDDPFPRYDATDSNKHGTRCAGVIAMVANNTKCGVGVAFNSRIGGIKLLDGTVTDSKEAAALSKKISFVDIYSSSWGPNDDGKTTQKPHKLASEAFLKGIKNGRSGLGVLFVFASGNGGAYDDNCNCDGYVSSMYSLSISSVTASGNVPYYAERCASTLAATFSSGSPGEPKVVSTDLHGDCTTQHSGTSAAAPIAAGMFALLLERNPKLSWRDVKHIVAWTSEYSSLRDIEGWHRNGAGFWLNDAFGFGLLNGKRMIELADPATWKNVPAMTTCEIDIDLSDGYHPVGTNDPFVANVSTTGCAGEEGSEVNYIEHVVLFVTMNYTRRGDIQVYLYSPMKTNVTMLRSRKLDESNLGLNDWPLTSIQHWGEAPQGDWLITIGDTSSRNNTGFVHRLKLVFHGTKDIPDHVSRLGPQRKYSPNASNVVIVN